MSEKGNKILAYDETFSCVQCGYCLPACPTYLTMKKETHSPRGRINLVRMAAEGKIELESLQDPIDLCLGCRACETVCPTNVPYGTILESAKVALLEKEKRTLNKSIHHYVYKKTIPSKLISSITRKGIRFYQKTGLQRIAEKTGLLNTKLQSFDQALPYVTKPNKRVRQVERHYSTQKSSFKVAFFIGCMMDTMFARVNDLSIKLLRESGCEVILIKEQTCCGALQHHGGDRETARELAKKNIEAFEHYQFDFVVNSIGGCGAMLVEYHHLFENDKEWYERAKRFAAKNKDISYVLSKVSLPFRKEIRKVVTYQPSCHMTNVQKMVKEPLMLLKSIPGITYHEHDNATMCCGSAGIYNLVHYEESMDILDVKMENVKKVKPDLIVTTNPGCHIQMKLGVKRAMQSNSVSVLHLVELLAEACEIELK